LDWLVPFDNDIFVMADPGDSQFVVRGGSNTPQNASMVLTTEFQMQSDGARPTSTGRTILLPFLIGNYSGVKEFYTDSDSAANAADSLTETQDRYIDGVIRNMAVSQNFNTALFQTDVGGGTIWVYKYLWDKTELLQSAWSKWQFKDNVLYFFFDNSVVYIICSDDEGVFLHSLDLNRPLNVYGYHTTMDRQKEYTVREGNKLVLTDTDTVYMQGEGCRFPGTAISPTIVLSNGAGAYDVLFSGVDAPVGAKIVVGQSVDWLIEPTQVFGRDYQQRVDTSRKVTVQDYIVHVERSGVFTVAGTSPYGGDWAFDSYAFSVDNEPLDPQGLGLVSGPIQFPWGERADYSKLTIKGNDIRPVTIHELEWLGQISTSRGQRT